MSRAEAGRTMPELIKDWWIGPEGRAGLEGLLLQQAGMAGHAQPLAILKNPGIGKAPEMLIRLGSVGAFRMISTPYNRRRGIHIYLHVLDIHEGRLELRVREIRQELSSIADFSIPFGIDELVADHAS